MLFKVTNTFRKTLLVFRKGYRQIISMGGSRSSKTYSILQILLLIMITKKNKKITVWRDTKVTCRGTVLEDFKKIIMFNDRIYSNFKENKQSGTFTYLPTGSRIIFEGADSIGKVLGGAQDISYFNEITEFSKDVYLQITQRTADMIFCDYNPSKDFWLESYREDPNTEFLHSTFKDNAYCPPNIVEQLLSYEPWEPNSYEIRGSELFYNNKLIDKQNQPPAHKLNVKRQTANEYMWRVYGLGLGAEKPNKIYSGWIEITPAEFNAIEGESYFGLDFGSANPTAVVEVKYGGHGDFYIYPRFYKPIQDLEISLTRKLANEIKGITNKMIIADPAKPNYITMLEEQNFYVQPAIKGPGSVNTGITLVQGFKIHYVHTKNFKNEYDNYSWSVDRYNKPTDNPEKKDDHYMDSVRYVISYLVRYLGIQV